ncbi:MULTISPECIES: bifunctional hydroxymethylpyrimidine kinase/phosphomethylpyrimidine kinase [unclassified Acidovorax]|uniref:bifunctional hydroxymethylpyrimidine kinase/phosphomethylpyrimidine kinase n=1 Tax=unclassified Acidovorax TaxID=2684926 RepID=UPI00070AC081|nr:MULTISPECIES: bifunctional hydroxymethylpyrimidine kinase/phosphomethylpyrimidine kinase [unclassified Acidovorax]KRC19445.1 hydroxymethylpyrimidine/phosphomethylpyrimidine kinase [Acidovorax sp. Root219]KRC23361.1 hydroxymethylpyrimidine/phosphomethylpyrimidine kinase [Acidovorax sp. Root217]
MTTSAFPPPDTEHADDESGDEASPACVLVFNASDPSGAGGLTADITTIASVGGHPIAVVTGAYARDTAQIFDHFSFDDEAVSEQARAVLEDMPVQAIKVGFVGSPENISAIAEITTDYDEVPVIAYMPNLSWWTEEQIDEYLDAFRELLLPQTSVLVGNHSTLWRWLLPDWKSDRSPTARDIARAASEMGVPYTLVTGIPLPEQFVENVLASPQTVLGSGKFELFDATFSGAGDTLSAALTALVASGNDLGEATSEALGYLDRCLDAGFRPGMGHIVPDRMFWAQPDDEDGEDDDAPIDDTAAIEGFVMPPHDTKH